MKISGNSICQRETGVIETQVPFVKVQHTKYHLSHSTSALAERVGADWSPMRKTGIFGSGETAIETAARTPVLSPSPPLVMPSFLGGAPLHISAWGNAIVPPFGFPVAPSCRAPALLRSQLPGLGGRGMDRLRRCQ